MYSSNSWAILQVWTVSSDYFDATHSQAMTEWQTNNGLAYKLSFFNKKKVRFLRFPWCLFTSCIYCVSPPTAGMHDFYTPDLLNSKKIKPFNPTHSQFIVLNCNHVEFNTNRIDVWAWNRFLPLFLIIYEHHENGCPRNTHTARAMYNVLCTLQHWIWFFFLHITAEPIIYTPIPVLYVVLFRIPYHIIMWTFIYWLLA